MKTKVGPKVASNVKLRAAIIFAGAGLVIATIVGVISFLSINLGHQEDALAANYSTNQNGNWSAGATWVGGSAPGDWANHVVTLNHNITGTATSGQDKTIQDFISITLTSGRTFTTTRHLTLNFIDNFLANGGNVTINGNLTLSENTIFTMNSGNLVITGSLTVQNGSSLIFNSTGTMTVSGNTTLNNNSVMTVNSGAGNINISGNLNVNNGSDINFNSTGSLNVGGSLTSSGGSGKDININSGSLNVTGNVGISSGTNLNIADGATLNTATLSTSNNSDAIVNLNGTGNITGDVDLRGPFNVGSTGNVTIGGDVSIKDGSGTLNVAGIVDIAGTLDVDRTNGLIMDEGSHVTVGEDLRIQGGAHSAVVDGLLEVGRDVYVTGGSANMTGTGILAWNGDITISGGSANINGYTSVPGSPLDLASMTTTVLPVELLSFSANVVGKTVEILWQTATELNNDFFTIERSSNGIRFETIAEVKGNGTTKDISGYEYVDQRPLNGLSYYRLKQTDFDGANETFRPVSVHFEAATENAVTIYPNPILGQNLKLRLDNPEEGNIEIIDQNGTKVLSEQFDGFISEQEFTLPSTLRQGVYIVNVKTASIQKTVKLVKR